MAVDPDEPLVTAQMVGLFVAFGADLVIIAGALALVGVVPWAAAGVITVLVMLAFGSWVGLRWRSRRAARTAASADAAAEEAAADPVETLKRRYAAGELSDEEFKDALDRVLDVPSGPRSGDSPAESESAERELPETEHTEKEQ
ncbi:hypothetical protein JCM17823_17570 [Halorubrum gandharaense]